VDKPAIFAFLRSRRLAVISTIHPSGAPESALIGYAVTPSGGVVFDTEANSRKAANLAARPQAALVVGWEGEETVQIEGLASRPDGAALESAKAAYFATWPDGRARALSPGIVHFVIEPRWIRYSSFAPVVEIVEIELG